LRVATVEHAVVGMVATSHEEGYRWIDHLYVAPDLVGRGIGTAPLRDALDGLERPVRLWTFQDNEGARRFYGRHGFKLAQRQALPEFLLSGHETGSLAKFIVDHQAPYAADDWAMAA